MNSAPGHQLAKSFDLHQDAAAGGQGGASSRPRLARWFVALTGFGEGAPGRVRLHTVSLIRWVAVIGQLFTILFVHFSLGIALPLATLLPAVALSALVNLVLGLGLKATTRLPERSAAALFAFDIVQLCYLLALTGGVQNPFAALLLVPVALAAVTLDIRSAMAITALWRSSASPYWPWPPGPLPWRDGGPDPAGALPGRRLGGAQPRHHADRRVRLERRGGGAPAFGGPHRDPAGTGPRAAAVGTGRAGGGGGPPAGHAPGHDQHHRQGAGARAAGRQPAGRGGRRAADPGQALPRAAGRPGQARRRGRPSELHPGTVHQPARAYRGGVCPARDRGVGSAGAGRRDRASRAWR